MRSAWWFALFLATCTLANAASFDCAKAKTTQEKAVCASPELSKADDQMAAAYHAWLIAAQPHDNSEIRKNQRTWLHIVSEECNSEFTLPQMQTCLEDAYHERTEDLRKMVQRKSGVTFIWRSVTVTVPDEPGGMPLGVRELNPGFGTLQASWPQATANTPEWSAWNRAIENETGKSSPSLAEQSKNEAQWTAEPDVDSETTISLGTVSEQMVTVTINNSWDGHGAHANGGSTELNWLLNKQRPIKPEDVFLPASGSDKWMLAQIDQYLHHALDADLHGDYKSFLQPGDMQKVLQSFVVDPESWTLDPRGLTIVFQPYQVACYACTPAPFTFSWADLKPYLQPSFALPR